MNENILVSISCITFNHEPYIRQCLEGFLMQKTNFKFEVLIHDDASTDGTEEIIREYEAKYPDIIKPLYEKENQWNLGRRGSSVFNYPRAQGKYIALCEGDDYWIDPYKLQKQVDFLENNPEYVLSNTEVNVLYEESGLIINNFNLVKNIHNYTGSVLIQDILKSNYFIKTGTVVFRSYLLSDYFNSKYYLTAKDRLMMGDTPMWAFMSLKGLFHYLDSPTAVYRRHKGSVSNRKLLQNRLRFRLSSAEMRLYFIKYFREEFSEQYIKDSLKSYEDIFINNLCLNPKKMPIFQLSNEGGQEIKKIQHNKIYRLIKKQTLKTKFWLFTKVQDLYYLIKKCH